MLPELLHINISDNNKVVPTVSSILLQKSAWKTDNNNTDRRQSTVNFVQTVIVEESDYIPKKENNNAKKKKAIPTSMMNDGIRRVDFVLVYENEEQHNNNNNKQNHHHHNIFQQREAEKSKIEKTREYFQENLRSEGLELEFETVQEAHKSLTFVKVHATWLTLCRMAEKLKLNMPLWIHDAPVVHRKSQLSMLMENLWYCLWYSDKIREKRRRSLTDKTLITWPFSIKNIDRYAVVDESMYFSVKQRIEIVWAVLQNTRNDPGDSKRCGIERLIHKGVYESCYPLHDGRFEYENDKPEGTKTLRQKLTQTWANWGAFYKPQPLDSVRKYFGEKISFYFGFMDFYTKMLIFPTIMGVVAFLYGMFDTTDDEEVKMLCDHHHPPGSWYHCPICRPPACEPGLISHEGCMKYQWDFRLDNEATMALSYLTMLWAILFLKYWKRRESKLAANWDTLEIQEEDSMIRTEFAKRAPTQRINPITLQSEPHMPFHSRAYRMAISILVTISVLCLHGLCLLILLICRIAMYGGYRNIGGIISKYSIDYARWTIHGFLFITIALFEKIYHYVAHKLTTFECPRTNNGFMNSLLWKLFIFEMLNEFIPIWYAAFLKGKTHSNPVSLTIIDEMCDGSCMFEVTELVAVLLLLRLVVGNGLEIGVPLLKNVIVRFRSKIPKTQNHQPQWVRDFHLNEVEMDGVYEDYMEMMIQFAFIILFIPAFPLAPLVCLINNILEIRLDSIKILRARRRPIPIRVPGIPQWNLFMDIIVKLAVVCNAGLLAFTSELVGRLYYKYQVSETGELTGFAKYMMSSIHVEDYGKQGEEMLHLNISVCYYGDMRDSEPPYSLKPEFWYVLVLRLTLFTTYLIFFFALMWIINHFVSDIPSEVQIAAKRKKYIVMKCLETEGGLHKSYWDKTKLSMQENGTQLNNRNRSFDWQSESLFM